MNHHKLISINLYRNSMTNGRPHSEKRGSDVMNQMVNFHSKRENDQAIVSNPNRNIPGLETQKEFIIFIVYNIIPGISEEQNVQH